MTGFQKTIAAAALVVAALMPALAVADEGQDELVITPPAPTTVLDLGEVLARGNEVRLAISETGKLVITINRPAAYPPCWYAGLAHRSRFLDRWNRVVDLDDFGGPFGWRVLPLVDPITASPADNAAAPSDSADQACP